MNICKPVNCVRFTDSSPAIHTIAPEMGSWAPDDVSPMPTEFEQKNTRALTEKSHAEATTLEVFEADFLRIMTPIYEKVSGVIHVPLQRRIITTHIPPIPETMLPPNGPVCRRRSPATWQKKLPQSLRDRTDIQRHTRGSTYRSSSMISCLRIAWSLALTSIPRTPLSSAHRPSLPKI
jgi:hypothetical protein